MSGLDLGILGLKKYGNIFKFSAEKSVRTLELKNGINNTPELKNVNQQALQQYT